MTKYIFTTEQKEKYTFTTQQQVRRSFWEAHPEFQSEYRAKKRQNDYNATIGSAFGAWVDHLQKDGQISVKLAYRVTL
jgi:hypothetical protein